MACVSSKLCSPVCNAAYNTPSLYKGKTSSVSSIKTLFKTFFPEKHKYFFIELINDFWIG